jgi:hypothetical protein
MSPITQLILRLTRFSGFARSPVCAGLRRIVVAVGLPLAAVIATPAYAVDLCNNTNGNAVQNNPASHRTPCHLSAPAHITQLVT